MKYVGSHYEMDPGESFLEAAAEAYEIAAQRDIPVYFEYLGTTVRVVPGMNLADIAEQWVTKRSTKWPEIS